MHSTTALLALALAAAAKQAAPAPWEGAPLQADPAEVARVAAALDAPKDADVDVLLDETAFSFDAGGRCTTTRRLVYRPLTREAAEAWAQIAGTWAPWNEERPEIRARVVTRSGEVHLLDPATLTEAGFDDEDDAIYTDRRTLRGPLPAAEAGVVVEQVIAVQETAPAFDAGAVRRYHLGVGQPTRRVRLRLEAPAGVPLAWRSRGGIPGTPRERTEAGRRVLDWDWSDVSPRKRLEYWLPPDWAPPQIVFTTAKTWRAVAARYAELVERQLAGEDLAETARAIVSRGDSAARAAQKLLDWISARVRYTGLELGESAIVPARARETLARRYGDCKDLSLLLAGLLRASGHPATLALLRTHLDEVVPDLPGFGLFDHAIVYVPGPRPLFIDPTDPSTPVGELPPGDQGRLALVVAPSTAKLTRTPEAGPKENRIVTTREIVLPEHGWAHAVETRELFGAPAAAERAIRRRARPSDRTAADEAETKVAKEHFAAEVFVGATYEGVDDAQGRVRVRLEAERSHWGVTNDDDAEAMAEPHSVAEHLPWPLQPPAQASDGEGPPPAREHPVWLPQPYAAELRYRIVPAPGFRADELPKGETRRIGPARYVSAFAEEKDGAVSVSYRFEIGARRIAPADADAIRATLGEILRPAEPKIRFRRTSTVLLDAGKGREALDEIRRLIAVHPRQARYHNHLAIALLRLGMGDAARRAARSAVELDPKNEWAHRVLASALAHDRIGRFLSPGCDIAGAIAAQRRAVELDPKARSRAHLAFLLTHDDRCARFGDGANLDEAIALLRAVRDELKSAEHDDTYLETLVQAGRLGDALALARGMKPAPLRNAALLAATAAIESPEAAAREGERLSPDARSAALQGALRLLVRTRRYATVAGLLRAASAGATASAQLQAQAAMFERVRRFEDVRLDPADPATVPRRVFRALFAGADSQRALEAIVARDPSPTFPESGPSGLAVIQRMLRQQRNLTGFGDAVALDLLDSLMEVRVEGDPAVAVRLTSLAPNGSPLVLYAVPDGSFRVIATFPEVAGLGALARRRVDAGDLPEARRLLGWARGEGSGTGGEDMPGAILAALWTHGADATARELHAAAAALEAFAAPADVFPVLEALQRAAPRGAARRALSWALAAGYKRAKRWSDALAIADELLASQPASAAAFELKARALLELRRGSALRELADARLRADPRDAITIRYVAIASMRAGDGDDVDRQLRRVVEMGKAEPADYNNLAWSGLLRAKLPADAVAHAQKAVQLSGERQAAYLHTLAAVHAANGEPAEAWQVLQKAIQWGTGDPESHDWLVIGKIAEQLGLFEDAAAAYERVTAGDGADGSTSAAIARKWAARLQRG